MLICPLLKQVRTAAAAARANQQKAKPVLFVNIQIVSVENRNSDFSEDKNYFVIVVVGVE